MRITSRGQITIPHHLRQDLGLLPHTEVVFEAGEDCIILRFRLGRRALIRERLRRAMGAGTGERTTDEIMRLTRGEDWPEVGLPSRTAISRVRGTPVRGPDSLG